VLEFDGTFLSIGDVIHLSKWRRLRWKFLWEPSRRVYQLPMKFGPLILPFDDLNNSLSKNLHLQTYTDHGSVKTPKLARFLEFDDDLGLDGKETSEDIHPCIIHPKRIPFTQPKIARSQAIRSAQNKEVK